MPRPFLETLGAIRRGALLDEAAVRLQDLVQSVKSSGRGGSMTIKLSVKPAGKGSRVLTVVVEDEVTLKMPPPDRESTIFFPTDDGALARNDPRQPDLDLRPVGAVDKETGEIRTGTGDSEEVRRV